MPSTWAAPRPSVALSCVLAILADANEPTAPKASVATPAAMKSFLIMAGRFFLFILHVQDLDDFSL